MITVTVDAERQLARIEFAIPHGPRGTVVGYSETVLRDADGNPYGAMPGVATSRVVSEVLDDTVEIEGTEVHFAAVMDTLEMFFAKWRLEDEGKTEMPPAPEPVAMTVPQGEMDPRPMYDELPPPLGVGNAPPPVQPPPVPVPAPKE
jgi:hypothetical protein